MCRWDGWVTAQEHYTITEHCSCHTDIMSDFLPLYCTPDVFGIHITAIFLPPHLNSSDDCSWLAHNTAYLCQSRFCTANCVTLISFYCTSYGPLSHLDGCNINSRLVWPSTVAFVLVRDAQIPGARSPCNKILYGRAQILGEFYAPRLNRCCMKG